MVRARPDGSDGGGGGGGGGADDPSNTPRERAVDQDTEDDTTDGDDSTTSGGTDEDPPTTSGGSGDGGDDPPTTTGGVDEDDPDVVVDPETSGDDGDRPSGGGGGGSQWGGGGEPTLSNEQRWDLRNAEDRPEAEATGGTGTGQTGTTVATGIDQGTDGLPSGLDPTAVGAAASSAEQSFLENNPGFDEEDVSVRLVETEEGEYRTVAELNEEGEAELDSRQAEQIEASLEEEYDADFVPGEDFTIGADGQPDLTSAGEQKIRLAQFNRGAYSEITADDLTREDGEVTLTEEAAAEEAAARDETVPESQQGMQNAAELIAVTERTDQAADTVESELEQQYGVDVERGEDFTIDVTDEGEIQPELTDRGTRRLAAAQTEAEFGRQGFEAAATAATLGQVDREIIAGVSQAVDTETARDIAGVEVDPETDLRVEDGDPQLTDEGAESLAEQQTEFTLEAEYGGEFERGRDFTIEQTDEGYQPELTDTGQRVVRAVETGRTLDAVGADALGGDFEPTPQEVRDDPSQFGEDGERFGGQGWFERNVVDPATEGFNQYFAEPAGEIGGDIIEFGSRGMVAADPAADWYVPEEAETAREGQVASAQDVLRAPADEQSATTRGEKVGEAAVGGGLRTIGEIPNISIEAGEYAVAGGSSVLTDDFDDFVGESVEAGTEAAVELGEQAYESPYQTGGMLVGSLGATGATIRGATIVGGARAGRAASFAIQPGEELAITAARTGVASRGLATRVPGVREGHIGGSGGDAGTTGSGAGIRASIGERLPNVEARAGRDVSRGSFEMNVNTDLRRRLMDAEQTVANVPGRIRDRVTPSEGSFLADDATARLRPEDLSQPAARVARRAGATAQSVRGTVADAPGRIRTGARNVGVEVEAGYYRVRDRIPSGEGAAMNFERFQRDRPETLRPNVGYVYDADASIASRVRDRIPTGEGAAMNFERFQRDRPETLRPNTGYVYDADASIASRVRDRIPSRGDLAMEIRRTRRDYTGGYLDRARGTVDDVRERSFVADESTRSGMTTADVPVTAAEAAESAAATVRSVRDFGVRVDVGRPGRRQRSTAEMTVEDAGVRYEGDVEADADQPLPYDPGEGDVGDGPATDQIPAEFRAPGQSESTTAMETDYPQQQAVQRQAIEIDARRPESDATSPRMEPSVEEGMAAGVDVSSFEAQGPSVGPWEAGEVGIDQAPELETRMDTAPELGVRPGQEPGQVPGQEPVQEPTFEPVEVQRQELRVEAMPNPEPRGEALTDPDGPPDDDPEMTWLEEESETFRTGFATAEELEKAFDDAARR